MNQPKKSFLLAALFVFCFGLTALFAQTPTKKSAEPSFDVILQTVVASNEAGGESRITPSLNNVVRKLKSDFPFSSYRLNSAAFQRINNRGNGESKSVSYTTDKNLPIFTEWTISGLESLVDESGQESIQMQTFRFGQRVPIDNVNNLTAYETVGLTNRFSLPRDTPTVVGSLTTAKPDELMFLILTVKSAEK